MLLGVLDVLDIFNNVKFLYIKVGIHDLFRICLGIDFFHLNVKPKLSFGQVLDHKVFYCGRERNKETISP